MEYRDSYEYLTLRGDESASTLLAVRCQVAESLELLHFEKKISRTLQEEADQGAEAEEEEQTGFRSGGIREGRRSNNTSCVQSNPHWSNNSEARRGFPGQNAGGRRRPF